MIRGREVASAIIMAVLWTLAGSLTFISAGLLIMYTEGWSMLAFLAGIAWIIAGVVHIFLRRKA